MPTNFITWLNELSFGQPQLLTFADHDGNKTCDMLKDTPLATPHKITGVIRDVATFPGVDMEIKDTEVEHMNKEMDSTKMPITSDAPIVKTVNDYLPMFNLKGDDNHKICTHQSQEDHNNRTSFTRRNREIISSATSINKKGNEILLIQCLNTLYSTIC
jgi:hypothetical protein